jgi:hypothetical protein
MRPVFRRAEYLRGYLSPECRTRLDAELAQIVTHWTPDQRTVFLAAVDASLDEYFALDKPLRESEGHIIDILGSVAEHARKAAEGLSRIPSSDRRWLSGHVWAACKLNSEIEADLVVQSPAMLAAALASLVKQRRNLEAGHRPKSNANGAPIDGPIRALVSRVAVAFEFVGGKAPSSAKEGHFARVIDHVLSEAKIDASLGQKRLKSILARPS